MEKFFTVGTKQLDNTLKVYKKYQSKISVIGNVRFDLLKKFKKFIMMKWRNKKKYENFIYSSTFNRLHYGMPDMPPSPGRDYMQNSYDNQKNLEVKLKNFYFIFLINIQI